MVALKDEYVDEKLSAKQFLLKYFQLNVNL